MQEHQHDLHPPPGQGLPGRDVLLPLRVAADPVLRGPVLDTVGVPADVPRRGRQVKLLQVDDDI